MRGLLCVSGVALVTWREVTRLCFEFVTEFHRITVFISVAPVLLAVLSQTHA
jgi:hypothetical protein